MKADQSPLESPLSSSFKHSLKLVQIPLDKESSLSIKHCLKLVQSPLVVSLFVASICLKSSSASSSFLSSSKAFNADHNPLDSSSSSSFRHALKFVQIPLDKESSLSNKHFLKSVQTPLDCSGIIDATILFFSITEMIVM